MDNTISELPVTTSDEWQFAAVGSVPTKVIGKFNSRPKGPVRLLSIANKTNKIACASNKQLTVFNLDTVREALSNRSTTEDLQTVFEKEFDEDVTNVCFSADECVLFVTLKSNNVFFYLLDQQSETFASGLSKHEEIKANDDILDFQPFPHASTKVLVLFNNGTINVLDITSKTWKIFYDRANHSGLGPVSAIAFNDTGDNVIIATSITGTDESSRQLVITDVSGTIKSKTPVPKTIGEDFKIIYIRSTKEDTVFNLIAFDENAAQYDGYMVSHKTENSRFVWQKFEPAQPFGDDERYPVWYSVTISGWSNNKDFPPVFVSSSSQSDEISLVTGDDAIQFVNDSDRGNLPEIENDDDEDCDLSNSIVGFALDISSDKDVSELSIGSETDTKPQPILWVLDVSGSFSVWTICNKTGILNDTLLLEKLVNEHNRITYEDPSAKPVLLKATDEGNTYEDKKKENSVQDSVKLPKKEQLIKDSSVDNQEKPSKNNESTDTSSRKEEKSIEGANEEKVKEFTEEVNSAVDESSSKPVIKATAEIATGPIREKFSKPIEENLESPISEATTERERIQNVEPNTDKAEKTTTETSSEKKNEIGKEKQKESIAEEEKRSTDKPASEKKQSTNAESTGKKEPEASSAAEPSSISAHSGLNSRWNKKSSTSTIDGSSVLTVDKPPISADNKPAASTDYTPDTSARSEPNELSSESKEKDKKEVQTELGHNSSSEEKNFSAVDSSDDSDFEVEQSKNGNEAVDADDETKEVEAEPKSEEEEIQPPVEMTDANIQTEEPELEFESVDCSDYFYESSDEDEGIPSKENYDLLPVYLSLDDLKDDVTTDQECFEQTEILSIFNQINYQLRILALNSQRTASYIEENKSIQKQTENTLDSLSNPEKLPLSRVKDLVAISKQLKQETFELSSNLKESNIDHVASGLVNLRVQLDNIQEQLSARSSALDESIARLRSLPFQAAVLQKSIRQHLAAVKADLNQLESKITVLKSKLDRRDYKPSIRGIHSSIIKLNRMASEKSFRINQMAQRYSSLKTNAGLTNFGANASSQSLARRSRGNIGDDESFISEDVAEIGDDDDSEYDRGYGEEEMVTPYQIADRQQASLAMSLNRMKLIDNNSLYPSLTGGGNDGFSNNSSPFPKYPVTASRLEALADSSRVDIIAFQYKNKIRKEIKSALITRSVDGLKNRNPQGIMGSRAT